MHIGFDAIGFAAVSEGPQNFIAFAGNSVMGLDWQIVIRAATREYISRPTDRAPNQVYLGTLEKAFRIDRSILGSRIGAQVTAGYGEVRLNNLERNYDFLAVDSTPLGQPIEILYGDHRRPMREWKTIMRGFMVDVTPTRESATFRVRDGGFRLDVPTSPNLYLGTGGEEGGDDLVNKTKPRVFGWANEVTAPLVITASNAFQLNDGQIHAVVKCRVVGIEQTFSADYATVALMNAAALSVGHYATCLAKGWGRVAVANASEVNSVTWDIAGDKTGGVFVETTADIVRRILNTATDLVDPDELVTSSFDVLNDRQPAPVQYVVPAGSEETVAASVQRLMSNIGGSAGFTRKQKLEVRRFEIPSGTPAGRYDKSNLIDVAVVPMPADLSPPPWRVRVAWGKIWTTNQSNLAGSVSAAYVAFLKDEVRFASAENETTRINFPPGKELIWADGLFRDQADAQLEAARQLALWGTSDRALYGIKLAEPKFIHELHQTIFLQWKDRFDLKTGKLARIVKLTDDDSEGVSMVVLV